ncbi:unnamed protein product, partial [Closterium sp. Naga37s-1]
MGQGASRRDGRQHEAARGGSHGGILTGCDVLRAESFARLRGSKVGGGWGRVGLCTVRVIRRYVGLIAPVPPYLPFPPLLSATPFPPHHFSPPSPSFSSPFLPHLVWQAGRADCQCHICASRSHRFPPPCAAFTHPFLPLSPPPPRFTVSTQQVWQVGLIAMPRLCLEISPPPSLPPHLLPVPLRSPSFTLPLII